MFKVIEAHLTKAKITTYEDLFEVIRAAYRWQSCLPLRLFKLKSVGDWKETLTECLVGLTRHTVPHVFKFAKNSDGEVRMWYKKYVTPGKSYDNGVDEDPILKQAPSSLMANKTQPLLMQNFKQVMLLH